MGSLAGIACLAAAPFLLWGCTFGSGPGDSPFAAQRIDCFGEAKRRIASARGDFPGTGGRTRMFLENAKARGCLIAHEGGARPIELGAAAHAFFVNVCRDPGTGRDHALVHTSGGAGPRVEVWSVVAATRTPVLLYSQGWGNPERVGGQWGMDRLVAGDGTCLWRERRAVRETVEAALSALGVGGSVRLPAEGLSGLPTRAIPAAAARKWLESLGEAALLEGAVYADEAGRSSWRVVQALGSALCEAAGVVLVLERRRGVWRSVYDIAPGCPKRLNPPLRGMVVKGDRLFASVCADCEQGEYRGLVIDLRSFTVRASRTGAPGARPSGNPPIRDLAREIFGE